MNPVQRPDSYEGADYSGVLRRRWWIILALTCVGLIGAFGYVLVAPKVYTSTAVVNVSPTAADQSNAVANSRTSGATVNLDTEAQVVVSTAVAQIAAKMMHSSLTPWQLGQQILVTVPANSSVLAISCSAPSAAGAATCAQDFAVAYLQNRSNSAKAKINGAIKTLQTQLNALEASINTLSTRVSTLPAKSTKRLSTKAQLKIAQSKAHAVTAAQAALAGQLANTNGGSIITNASPPGKPSSPKKTLILPSGLVAGLLIGLIVAFVVDRRDKSIHGPRDVERSLDLPVLLDLPPDSFGRPVSLASPRSRTGKAFTELANAVSAALGEGHHVLLVAGTTRGPSTSVIAANLATTLARTHSEVVLICADLNGSVAPQLFGLEPGEGLAELVAGDAVVREVARAPAGIPGLWVITPGADTSLAIYNFQHDKAHALTSQLRRDARYVVIEAQATEEGADTFALSEFADAAILTVEVSRTKTPEAADCVRRLRLLRTPLLGAVVGPALSGRVSVRPAKQGQSRPGAGKGEPRRDGIPAGRRVPDMPAAMSVMPTPEADRPPAHSRDGYRDRADRVSGN
jgi:capsular polysaccharide biosynthesis protein/MinD-like ATPase involved in chromosome partitioning or flagellar assembly